MKLQSLSIDLIEANPAQPRKHFCPQSLAELADSIRAHGLIEPLIVRRNALGSYELVAGERRWRAANLAGLQSLPCVIAVYDEQQTALVSLIENIQRQDLNLIEEARAYQRLQQHFELQQEDIARLVGKSRSHISNVLRLLSLHSFVQDKVSLQQLSYGHARTLVGLSFVQQKRFASLAQQKDWSVRQMEAQIKQHKQPIDRQPPTKSADVHYLEENLSDQLGAPVQCQLEGEQGGWLKIKFYDNETLSGILSRLGLKIGEDPDSELL